MKLIAQGAEARIFDDGSIVKNRFSKGYRISELDVSLRKKRTRSEGKILGKVKALGVPCPAVLEVDDKEMILRMEKINGEKLRDVFVNDVKGFAYQVGKGLGTMHNAKIMHADLTTSNLLVKEGVVYFIDFGLGFISPKVEDRAVDIHLFERALDSQHNDIYSEAMENFLLGYRESCSNWKEVLDRLEVVKLRGRHKK